MRTASARRSYSREPGGERTGEGIARAGRVDHRDRRRSDGKSLIVTRRKCSDGPEGEYDAFWAECA